MLVSRQEAIAQGLKRYYTGKPCKRGHISERYLPNGLCVDCAIAYAKDWGDTNRERKRENIQNWRKSNRERDRENTARWRKDNPDKDRLSMRNWRSNNPHKEREYTRRRDAAKLQAVPTWADRDAIEAVYAEAERLTQETGIPIMLTTLCRSYLTLCAGCTFTGTFNQYQLVRIALRAIGTGQICRRCLHEYDIRV